MDGINASSWSKRGLLFLSYMACASVTLLHCKSCYFFQAKIHSAQMDIQRAPVVFPCPISLALIPAVYSDPLLFALGHFKLVCVSVVASAYKQSAFFFWSGSVSNPSQVNCHKGVISSFSPSTVPLFSSLFSTPLICWSVVCFSTMLSDISTARTGIYGQAKYRLCVWVIWLVQHSQILFTEVHSKFNGYLMTFIFSCCLFVLYFSVQRSCVL